MKFELIDHTLFKNAFESISKIVDEVVCKVDSEGFRVDAIDRSHICFVSLNLHKDIFDSYECDTPEKIFLDTEEFMKILKRAKKTDNFCLEYKGDNDLIINLDGDVERTFKIKLIDMEYETPMPPSIPYDVSCLVESDMIKDALVDMELFSDSATIEITDEYLNIFTDGEFGDANFQYLHGEPSVVETVSSSFSIPKLKDVFSASKFSEWTTLKVGNTMPLRVEFKTLNEDGELSFLLAPKISQEEDY